MTRRAFSSLLEPRTQLRFADPVEFGVVVAFHAPGIDRKTRDAEDVSGLVIVESPASMLCSPRH